MLQLGNAMEYFYRSEGPMFKSYLEQFFFFLLLMPHRNIQLCFYSFMKTNHQFWIKTFLAKIWSAAALSLWYFVCKWIFSCFGTFGQKYWSSFMNDTFVYMFLYLNCLNFHIPPQHSIFFYNITQAHLDFITYIL